MAIKIDDDLMTLEINGKVIAEAWPRPGGWWEVTCWPRFFDRHQAQPLAACMACHGA